jgi:hypothetical protein
LAFVDSQQSAAGGAASARFEIGLSAVVEFSVAPGNWGCFDAQPPASGNAPGIELSDMISPWHVGRIANPSYSFTSASNPCFLIVSIN